MTEEAPSKNECENRYSFYKTGEWKKLMDDIEESNESWNRYLRNYRPDLLNPPET